MKVIILAAGQGSRMGKITETTPKSLLPIGKTNIICRLISQLINLGSKDISIVVGYKESLLKKEISKISKDINFISNENYIDDINILSLGLALDEVVHKKFIVFEADCVYDSMAMNSIYESYADDNSYWYSMGDFNSNQKGGILLSNKNKNITDIKIVSKYQEEYSKYRKLIGVLKVGTNESSRYREFLNEYIKHDINQYYLQPWIDNLSQLNCSEVSLGNFTIGAFNDLKEYNAVLNDFEDLI